MASDTFEVNPRSLKQLLGDIHDRQLALPDFQRSFVWDPRMTEGLIESVIQRFPAGSLLFLPFSAETFGPRAFENAPELTGAPLQLVLDGQQRLTSLYQAFYGAGDHVYFVDLDVLRKGGEVEDAVYYRHRTRTKALSTLDEQARRLVFPLERLFGTPGGFAEWLDEVLDLRPEQGEESKELRRALRTVHRDYISTIEEYRFPVVSLARDSSLESVCSIFETLNVTGVRLSVFELLAARFYAKGLDLRKEWEDTKAEHPIIAEYSIDEYYLLQSISLRVKNSAKRGDVLALATDDIATHWPVVAAGCAHALQFLRDECGVLSSKWLPYAYFLVPLAACWADLATNVGPASGANRARIKRWFWCSGLSQTYDRSANSQAAIDYRELKAWGSDPNATPRVVADFDFDTSRLAEITPRQQSIYKALMAMVLSRRALDFHTGSPITAQSLAAGVDDHHVFPAAYLRNSIDPPKQLVDSILNRTLIDKTTNQRISANPPSKYLTDVETAMTDVKPDGLDQVLASHLLPTGADSTLRADDFAGFIQGREDGFAAVISSATS